METDAISKAAFSMIEDFGRGFNVVLRLLVFYPA
jgi:hypothetical protein